MNKTQETTQFHTQFHTQNHLNTYDLEVIKDKYLTDIKVLCFMFLDNKKNIKHITDNKIIELYEYIYSQYNEISSLRESLKVKTYYAPYTEIFKNLDNMINSDNLLCSQQKLSFIELTKDINYLEDTLSFCFGILCLIIQDRKIMHNNFNTKTSKNKN